MKFTLSWLKEHLETVATVEQIAETLTAIGLEVEDVADRAKALAPFEIAYVKEAVTHPNADRLRVCTVEAKSGTLQVVCGAPNARAGIKVVLAHPGDTIPTSGITLKNSEIRGIASQGMLCSERELGLGENHDGIMELPADAPVGEPFAPYMGLDDPVIEIAVTPNRGDCLGVHGIARDLAATGIGTLKPLRVPAINGTFDSPIRIELNDERCAQFNGCFIRGVTNGPSPQWLQRRLQSIGLRPISALVDITNYLTFDLGRPAHVYDASNIKGFIQSRPSVTGETLEALNGKTYDLPEGTCVIADGKTVLGIGGIIGGTPSGCTETTADVFLELAWFDPITIAKEGRALGIDSDARHRFERTVDPAFLDDGIAIATKLILDLCGGEASHVVRAGQAPDFSRQISFDPATVESWGGVSLRESESIEILTQLGFRCTRTDGAYMVQTPSWRPDVEGAADLVEEVLRIHGYDRIPELALPAFTGITQSTTSFKRAAAIRHLLAGRELTECVTFAFLQVDRAALFAPVHTPFTLENPISSELDYLRPSLLPNLLTATQQAEYRSIARHELFEVGNIFKTDGTLAQVLSVASLRAGQAVPKNVHDVARVYDLFDAKADAFAILETLGLNPDKLDITRDVPGYYHPGKSGALTLGRKVVLGYFGELHPSVAQAYDLKTSPVAVEIFLDAVPEPRAKASSARAPLIISDLPKVERDFAFVVDEATPVAELLKAVRAAEKQLLTDVTVFDIFRGKDVPPGKKSVALSITLEPKEKTLTDEEIHAISERIVAKVGEATGATLRFAANAPQKAA